MINPAPTGFGCSTFRRYLLLHCFDEGFKSGWILDGDLREYLSVEFDRLGLLGRDKCAVGHAIEAKRIVETRDPKAAEVSLLGSSITVAVLPSLEERFFGSSVVTLSSPAETFGEFQEVLSSFVCGDAAFDSRHNSSGSKKGIMRMEVLLQCSLHLLRKRRHLAAWLV